MHPLLFTLTVYTLFNTPAASASSDIDPITKNANHVFNVIHDSMRQWGSSLHHNGVSFFLATVPTGTQLYHGTSKAMPVRGTEWLAFEPEHAMVFARPRWGPPPGSGPPGGDKDEREEEGQRRYRDELRRPELQAPFDGRFDPPSPSAWDLSNTDNAGYLHTYAAAKDLRLLYIDGMSAAKTDKGTLDSQDVLLFNGTTATSPRRGMTGESERARKACEMAEHDWAGRIDGVLRMEAGFEVILCRFQRDLVPVRIVQVKSGDHDDPVKDSRKGREAGPDRDYKKGKGKGDGGPGLGPGPDSSRWVRAVTARYDGIGGNRVSLNYERFVTAFSHELDLFPPDATLPRLNHLSYAELKPIQKELEGLILTHDASEQSWNWQATTDMIVTRYSDELSYLASGKVATIEAFRDHIELLLSPFLDYSQRNELAEVERCATQFLPVHAPGTVAARAVSTVTSRICSTLLGTSSERDLISAVDKVQALMDELDWTTWKRCRGCEANEICVVPIWPMGTMADYDNPQCKEASYPYDHNGETYWERMPH